MPRIVQITSQRFSRFEEIEHVRLEGETSADAGRGRECVIRCSTLGRESVVPVSPNRNIVATLPALIVNQLGGVASSSTICRKALVRAKPALAVFNAAGYSFAPAPVPPGAVRQHSANYCCWPCLVSAWRCGRCCRNGAGIAGGSASAVTADG